MKALVLAAFLLWPAVVGAQGLINDADIGARVVFRTPAAPGLPSMKVEAVTEQHSYPYPFEQVFIRFGYDLDDRTVHIGIPSDGAAVNGRRAWKRTVANIAVTEHPEVVLIAIDSVGGVTGRSLACTQETPRRLVCRGGPTP